ncbi:MAG: hypothetical protein ACRCV3_00180 [Desulfovibrionaceae bacterium]
MKNNRNSIAMGPVNVERPPNNEVDSACIVSSSGLRQSDRGGFASLKIQEISTSMKRVNLLSSDLLLLGLTSVPGLALFESHRLGNWEKAHWRINTADGVKVGQGKLPIFHDVVQEKYDIQVPDAGVTLHFSKKKHIKGLGPIIGKTNNRILKNSRLVLEKLRISLGGKIVTLKHDELPTLQRMNLGDKQSRNKAKHLPLFRESVAKEMSGILESGRHALNDILSGKQDQCNMRMVDSMFTNLLVRAKIEKPEVNNPFCFYMEDVEGRLHSALSSNIFGKALQDNKFTKLPLNRHDPNSGHIHMASTPCGTVVLAKNYVGGLTDLISREELGRKVSNALLVLKPIFAESDQNLMAKLNRGLFVKINELSEALETVRTRDDGIKLVLTLISNLRNLLAEIGPFINARIEIEKLLKLCLYGHEEQSAVHDLTPFHFTMYTEKSNQIDDDDNLREDSRQRNPRPSIHSAQNVGRGEHYGPATVDMTALGGDGVYYPEDSADVLPGATSMDYFGGPEYRSPNVRAAGAGSPDSLVYEAVHPQTRVKTHGMCRLNNLYFNHYTDGGYTRRGSSASEGESIWSVESSESGTEGFHNFNLNSQSDSAMSNDVQIRTQAQVYAEDRPDTPLESLPVRLLSFRKRGTSARSGVSSSKSEFGVFSKEGLGRRPAQRRRGKVEEENSRRRSSDEGTGNEGNALMEELNMRLPARHAGLKPVSERNSRRRSSDEGTQSKRDVLLQELNMRLSARHAGLKPVSERNSRRRSSDEGTGNEGNALMEELNMRLSARHAGLKPVSARNSRRRSSDEGTPEGMSGHLMTELHLRLSARRNAMEPASPVNSRRSSEASIVRLEASGGIVNSALSAKEEMGEKMILFNEKGWV